MGALTLSDWLGFAGVAFGVLGLLYAWHINKRAIQAQQLRQQQFMISLDMARFLVTNHEVVEELWAPTAGPELTRWLWQSHEKASDLYKVLVDQYLAVTQRFKYGDLERLYKCGLLKSRWQEEQWRRQMAFRPENEGVPPPEYFVPADFTTHPMWYERLKEHRLSKLSATAPNARSQSAPSAPDHSEA